MKRKSAKRPKPLWLNHQLSSEMEELMDWVRLAERTRLAARAAHELNSPLMVVQGLTENLELLLADATFKGQPEVLAQLEQILHACARMNQTINEMQPARTAYTRLPVADLAAVAAKALRLTRARARTGRVRVQFEPSSPLLVHCDAAQVEQMFANLLSNAITALKQNSGPRHVRISFTQAGRWAMARVWNNGPPVPKRVHKHVKHPFAHATAPTVGLAVAKTLMFLHGGDLSLTSHADRGTEFVISFPKAAAPVKAAG